MKLLAFTIGGETNGQQGFTLTFPSQIAQLNNTVNLQKLITFVINFLIVGTALLAFAFLLVGGIKWIMSGGDKKQLEDAQKTIMYAIIGLLVVLLSFFIVNLIGFAFGIQGTLLNPK